MNELYWSFSTLFYGAARGMPFIDDVHIDSLRRESSCVQIAYPSLCQQVKRALFDARPTHFEWAGIGIPLSKKFEDAALGGNHVQKELC